VWFASLSHDRNPLHTDPVAARRLLSDRQVVHGIHVLLSALDLVRARSADGRHTLHCEFSIQSASTIRSPSPSMRSPSDRRWQPLSWGSSACREYAMARAAAEILRKT